MRIITLEEHVTTPGIVKAAPMAMRSTAFMQSIQAKLLDMGEGRIADMDAAGIDMQVLSMVANSVDKLDSATANDLARDANDRMAAAVREHPDRFAAFATVALQEADKAAAEGIVNLGSELKHWSHEERPVSLLRSSFPSRNHQLCRLGLPSFLPELP